VDDDYWAADNDYGEMFLNFWLHPDLRQYCGVDLTGTFPEELGDGKQVVWEAWSRNAMGLSPSPYASCQMGTRLKRLMLGDPDDPTNVFRWDRVVLNLPGSDDYDPSKPWVYKARSDGKIAADLHKYVDDVRETAPTKVEVEQASSKVAKVASYLGTQDAARKRRKAAQKPGAWSGACVETETNGVYKTIAEERWNKTKAHVQQLEDWCELDDLPRKELERIRGHLVYVSLTYTIFAPYLKGVHLTLESWREDRDNEGWKMTSVPDSVLMEKLGVGELDVDMNPPPRVKAVPRLKTDIRALKAFTGPAKPVRLRVRPVGSSAVIFIFGDASGTGFGTSLWVQGGSKVHIDEGLWKAIFSAWSSNFREMKNFALKL